LVIGISYYLLARWLKLLNLKDPDFLPLGKLLSFLGKPGNGD
jgi:hypothetical protein